MLVSFFAIQISHFLIPQEESAIGEPRRNRKKHMHADGEGLLTRFASSGIGRSSLAIAFDIDHCFPQAVDSIFL